MFSSLFLSIINYRSEFGTQSEKNFQVEFERKDNSEFLDLIGLSGMKKFEQLKLYRSSQVLNYCVKLSTLLVDYAPRVF